jgi:restriction system protein
MLNVVELTPELVDDFFERQWSKPLTTRYEIDDEGHYTVFDAETNVAIQRGWIAPGDSRAEIAHQIFHNVQDGLPTFSLQGAALQRYMELLNRPDLVLSAITAAEEKTQEGLLVASTSIAWAAIVRRINGDWSKVTEITPDQWEEVIAGAYKVAGYDEVVLTPHSGDHGRDVIAIRRGVGSVKIIGSVKAYKPGFIVGYDHIRAVLGVLAGERDASKAIITTTSNFPPKVMDDPFIAPFVPHRLELMNGEKTREWLMDLLKDREL